MFAFDTASFIKYLTPPILTGCFYGEHPQPGVRELRISVSRCRRKKKIRTTARFRFRLVLEMFTLAQIFFQENFTYVKLERTPGSSLPPLKDALSARHELFDGVEPGLYEW